MAARLLGLLASLELYEAAEEAARPAPCLQRRILSEYEYQDTGKHTSSVWTKYMLLSKYTDNAGKEYPFSKLEAGFMAAVRQLVERFDTEPLSDFSAK